MFIESPGSIPQSRRRRPLWLRLFLGVVTAGGSFLLFVVSVAGAFFILIQQNWFQQVFFQIVINHGANSAASEPSQTITTPYSGPRLDATSIQSAEELFHPTNIWETRLHFSASQWRQLGPRRIPPVPNWLAPDGSPTLRNPLASRAGVAGTLGWDLPWSSGDADFGGQAFTNAAIRFKGNGTFLEAMSGYKKSFKIDLDEGAPGRKFAGQKTLNLHNLIADRSFIADTLGYEFYRDAGVPAPRTTFTRVFLSVDGRFQDRLLGLYALIENPDKAWSRAALGTGGAVLFKPVATRLFEDLGKDWEAYDDTYAPRTEPSEVQKRRLIDLCQLVSRSDDAAFNRDIVNLLDLDETARFIACETLLSNYDGILMNGQNFILWLDPVSQRFGFSPWDLDHSWGEFGQVGSDSDRERASLFHPWVGSVRILERLFACPEFQTRYRRELTRLLHTLFVPDRLFRRIDQLAAVVRPAVTERPPADQRLAQFESVVGDFIPDSQAATNTTDRAGKPVALPHSYQLKHFIAVRATEAEAQLEGRSDGVRLERHRGW